MPSRLFCTAGPGVTLVGKESVGVGVAELVGRVTVEGEGSFSDIFGEEEFDRDAVLSLGI